MLFYNLVVVQLVTLMVSGATANRVALESMVMARNEGAYSTIT
jgi:hypothetical protein